MRRPTALLALLFAALLPALPLHAQPAATEPTTQEKEVAELQRVRKEREAEQAQLPKTHVKSLRDVVLFAIENDDLVLRTSIPPTENAAVVAEGADGFLTGGATPPAGGEKTAPYVPDTFRLMRTQFPEPPTGLAITQMTVIGFRVTVSKTSEIGGEYRNVELIQDNAFLEEGDERIRFYVQCTMNDEPVDDLKLSAMNIVELRRKYPAETMRYLEPIFRDFGQSAVLFQVSPRAAWQVLGGKYDPPAEATKQVEAILKRLDAESPQDRAAAAADLEKLGQPAALALMKRDRATLSEEQQTRVETFLQSYKPLTDDEAEKRRSDPEFLLTALSSDDAALAGLALERLKEVTKQPIAFELSSTGPARAEAIARLRAQLLPATTRPATTKATAVLREAP